MPVGRSAGKATPCALAARSGPGKPDDHRCQLGRALVAAIRTARPLALCEDSNRRVSARIRVQAGLATQVAQGAVLLGKPAHLVAVLELVAVRDRPPPAGDTSSQDPVDVAPASWHGFASGAACARERPAEAPRLDSPAARRGAQRGYR